MVSPDYSKLHQKTGHYISALLYDLNTEKKMTLFAEYVLAEERRSPEKIPDKIHPVATPILSSMIDSTISAGVDANSIKSLIDKHPLACKFLLIRAHEETNLPLLNTILAVVTPEQLRNPLYHDILNLIAKVPVFHDTTFVIKKNETESIYILFNKALFLINNNSSYLKILLGNHFKEASSKELVFDIQNYRNHWQTAEALQQCFEFCYTKQPIEVTNDNVIEIHFWADFLGLEELKSSCEQAIIEGGFNKDNYKGLFSVATACQSTALADAVFRYLFMELSHIKDVDLSETSSNELVTFMREEVIYKIAKGSFCRKIDLTKCVSENVNDTFLQFVSNCCPNLQSLVLPNNAQITDAGLQYLSTLTQNRCIFLGAKTSPMQKTSN